MIQTAASKLMPRLVHLPSEVGLGCLKLVKAKNREKEDFTMLLTVLVTGTVIAKYDSAATILYFLNFWLAQHRKI